MSWSVSTVMESRIILIPNPVPSQTDLSPWSTTSVTTLLRIALVFNKVSMESAFIIRKVKSEGINR